MKRILFVDDEVNVLEGIRRTLHADRNRWEMKFADSGDAALQLCDAGAFDIVVSDMRMPGMDGATLLSHIRDRSPDTARVILSGYSELALITRAIPVANRVLAKPCNGAELRTTLERVCMLQDLFCTPEIRRIIGAIGELPSPSSTCVALTKAVCDPDANVIDVAEIIQQDVAMSAKVLQLINSGFFGLARTVTSLQSAVSYLGIETMKNLVLASEIFQVLTPGSPFTQSACEAIQKHAHRTVVIAGGLPIEHKDRDITVVACLLHDIGNLVLASKMPEQFRAARLYAEEHKCEPFEAEEQLFGISHAEIGAYLLGLWGVSSFAVEAIAHHHRPTRISHSGVDSSAAIYIADLLARELETHPLDTLGQQLRDYDRNCLESLGLLEQFPDLRKRALESLKQA